MNNRISIAHKLSCLVFSEPIINNPNAVWVFIGLQIVLSFSLFARPLWPIKFGVMLNEMSSKFLINDDKTIPNIENLKQKLQDRDDYEVNIAKQIVKLIGIVNLLIAGFLLWSEISDLFICILKALA
jgi:hypothetical protein